MRLLPRNEDLFVHLREQIGLTHQAIDRLYALCTHDDARERKAAEGVSDLERRGNEALRKLTRGLRESFITPLDRNDLHRLAKRIDRLLNAIDAAAWRVCCYDERALEGPALALLETLRSMVLDAERAIGLLADRKRRSEASEACTRIHEAGRKADGLMREALTTLLASDPSAAALIKRKDVYEQLKAGIDHAEQLSETIIDMLLDE
jgi:hypothetical protein